ncbi:MAG: DUF5980 family protein [Actinomycetota bacterium]|nr:DUF5980 family protein [Actinomycetota bacterium]
MATHVRRSARILMGVLVVSGILASAFAGTAAATSTRTARWTLVDYHQSACFSSNVTDAYFGIWIDGTWRRSIDVGAANLPPGGTYTTSYAPIPPGSSDGVYSLAYVHVVLRSTQALGTYTADMWASDGRLMQSVPITLVVQSKCGY